MSLTDDEKSTLKDMALMAALAKLQLLTSISGSLRLARDSIQSFQNTWSEFARDPEIEDIKMVDDLYYKKIPTGFDYSEGLMRALGTETEDYAYAHANDDLELLAKEAGTPYDQDDPAWDYDREKMLPFEDPIEVYKRNK